MLTAEFPRVSIESSNVCYIYKLLTRGDCKAIPSLATIAMINRYDRKIIRVIEDELSADSERVDLKLLKN